MDHARHQRPASILGLSRKDLRSRLRGQSEERAFFVRTRLRNVRTVSAEPGKKKGKADQRIARSCERDPLSFAEYDDCSFRLFSCFTRGGVTVGQTLLQQAYNIC